MALKDIRRCTAFQLQFLDHLCIAFYKISSHSVLARSLGDDWASCFFWLTMLFYRHYIEACISVTSTIEKLTQECILHVAWIVQSSSYDQVCWRVFVCLFVCVFASCLLINHENSVYWRDNSCATIRHVVRTYTLWTEKNVAVHLTS